MSILSIIAPARRAVNPILTDDPVVDVESSSTHVFYTSSARFIAKRMDLIIAGSAGVCLSISWILSITSGPEPLVSLFILFAFAIAGIPAVEEVWRKISSFRIDIDLLMLLGAGLAAYIQRPFEGALLLFLFALSGALESYALRRTQSAITALRNLSPREATLMDGDQTRRVLLRHISVGAKILVKPGEKIPLDGEVVAGSSSLDESAITGESIPRDCLVGDEIFAGTQNLNGRLEIRVTKLAGDTTLAKIVELVTKARQHPARAQRLIDRIGPTYSVVVIVGSILVGVVSRFVFDIEVNESIRRGIAVLITASPCALIIATPVAYLSAIAAAARRGILIKGGVHLEVVAKAATVIFDKTGTLTTGQIRLTDIDMQDVDDSEVLMLIGTVEESSTHPLATAVSHALHERGLSSTTISDYNSIPGKGVSGVVKGRKVWVGRPDWINEITSRDVMGEIESRIERFHSEGKTVSAVVIDQHIGLLAFQDTIRVQSADCIKQLKRDGIRRVEMLTGDHDQVARRVSSILNLDGYLADLAPEDKLRASEKLREQYGSIVLVGDGINDAPALAHADVGIAVGSMGADVAIEAADIVLMKDRIDAVSWLYRHARRTAGIVRQNLALAIGVISILSVFAAMGYVELPLAVIGHEGSTVVVALNALRLLRSKE